MRTLFFALIFLLFVAPIPSQAAFDFVQIVPAECSCDNVAAEGSAEIISSAPGYGCVLQTIQNIIRVGISIAFVFAVFALMYAGFLWMTSSLNPANRGKAKQLLLNVFVGIAIILTSWLIVDFVMKTLYNENVGFGPWNNILAGQGASAEYCLRTNNPKALTEGTLNLTPAGSSSTATSSQPGTPEQGQLNKELYATPAQAARAALEYSNPRSIKDNLEYGGLIYRDLSGKYGWSGPVIGSEVGVKLRGATVPAGAEIVGDFHTHGDYSLYDRITKKAVRTSDPKRDSFKSDSFSEHDKKSARELMALVDPDRKKGLRWYLGTPSGKFLTYNPYTDTVGSL